MKRRKYSSSIGKVAVAMSGGIDSSTVAAVLAERGYNVVGVYMRNWDDSDEQGEAVCQATEDRADMQQVCDRLGIPSYEVPSYPVPS